MTLKCFTIYLKRKYKLIARDSVTDWDTDIKDRQKDRQKDGLRYRQKDRQTEKVVGFVLLSQEQDFFFFEKKISLQISSFTTWI